MLNSLNRFVELLSVTEFIFLELQVLEETQEKAVKSHFVSDPNNLYVG